MYLLVNLETMERSKKTWKTYRGALNNASGKDLITTEEGYEWIKNNPDWCKETLNQIELCKQ